MKYAVIGTAKSKCEKSGIIVSVFMDCVSTVWKQKLQIGGKIREFNLDSGAEKNIRSNDIVNSLKM